MWGNISLFFIYISLILVMLSTFSCTICMSSFKRCLFRSSAYFSIDCLDCLLLSWMGTLYILGINPLSDIWFVNMFSHSVISLVIMLMVSFAIQKLLRLTQSHLFTLFCCFCFWCQTQKKKCHCQDQCQGEKCIFSHGYFHIIHAMVTKIRIGTQMLNTN